MPAECSVTLMFHHNSRKVARRHLKQFLAGIAPRIAGAGRVTCLITGDAALHDLNRQFRHLDYSTDVLSFPSEAGGGEIAISLDTAARQAADLGHSLEQELRILILHGLLHLAGLDHETDSGAMARAESKWRKRLGLPQGLIQRAHRVRVPR